MAPAAAARLEVWRIFAGAPEGSFQMIDKIVLNKAYNVSAFGDQAQGIGRYLKEQ